MSFKRMDGRTDGQMEEIAITPFTLKNMGKTILSIKKNKHLN